MYNNLTFNKHFMILHIKKDSNRVRRKRFIYKSLKVHSLLKVFLTVKYTLLASINLIMFYNHHKQYIYTTEHITFIVIQDEKNLHII